MPISTTPESTSCQAKQPSDPLPAWVIAGDLSNTWDTHRAPWKHTLWILWGWRAGEPRAVVYSCLEKQEVNFSCWLPTEVDLPGQRSVCKAFYPFPGYMTGAGRETTELKSRTKAVSGLSWGCFTAAKLHWPQQCSHKQEEIPPWVAEYGFSQHIFFFLQSVAFFCSHVYFPRKVLQACLWMHIGLISFQLLTLSQIGSSTENNCIILTLCDWWHRYVQ